MPIIGLMRAISVLDYGMGNFASVLRMIAKVGGDARVITSPTEVEEADVVILPGVGSFDYGMEMLSEKGLDESLARFVADDRHLLIGICLGMQLLCTSSEEGRRPGLGLVDGIVTRFEFSKQNLLPIPHMGWNSVHRKGSGGLLPDGIPELRYYFAHSYKVELGDPKSVVGATTYGGSFCSAFQQGNIHGYQFHPEKSHRFGLALFENLMRG